MQNVFLLWFPHPETCPGSHLRVCLWAMSIANEMRPFRIQRGSGVIANHHRVLHVYWQHTVGCAISGIGAVQLRGFGISRRSRALWTRGIASLPLLEVPRWLGNTFGGLPMLPDRLATATARFFHDFLRNPWFTPCTGACKDFDQNLDFRSMLLKLSDHREVRNHRSDTRFCKS